MASTVSDPQRISYPVVLTSDISANNQVIGFRNRIINGNMRIDQRNVGASIAATNFNYCTDRWAPYTNFTNIGTTQQGTSNPPTGFTNYLNWLNSATLTTSTTSFLGLHTYLEGNTVADLLYGTANCQTMTLSFWVYVNTGCTGNYSFVIRNSATTVSYASFYIVPTASVWQKVTLVIPGAPSGTWVTDTGYGMELMWGLHGSGTLAAPLASYGTWTANNYIGTANMVNLGAISGSGFNITGVQFELGSLATKFEWRPWETEMRMCQRYYEKSYDYATVKGSNVNSTNTGILWVIATNANQTTHIEYKVEKRVAASFIAYNSGGTANSVYMAGGTTAVTGIGYQFGSTKRICLTSSAGFTQNSLYYLSWDANADF